MSNITELIKNIRNAVFGKDVRESIASAIEQTYEDASENGNANMEVTQARGSFDTLKKRLDNSDNVKADKQEIQNEATSRLTKDNDLQTQINVEKSRIDNLSELDQGSTTGDAELQDIRVGANGVIFNNAGSAVRNQINNINNDIKNSNIYDINSSIISYEQKTSTGTAETSSNNRIVSNYIFGKKGTRITVPYNYKINILYYYTNSLNSFYDSLGQWISDTTVILEKDTCFKILVAKTNDGNISVSEGNLIKTMIITDTLYRKVIKNKNYMTEMKTLYENLSNELFTISESELTPIITNSQGYWKNDFQLYYNWNRLQDIYNATINKKYIINSTDFDFGFTQGNNSPFTTVYGIAFLNENQECIGGITMDDINENEDLSFIISNKDIKYFTICKSNTNQNAKAYIVVTEPKYIKRNKLLNGVKFSILGDSISTFNGYLPSDDNNYDGASYASHYPKAQANITSVDNTWWMKLANKSGLTLLQNASWSGSFTNGNSSDNNSAYAGCSNRRISDLAKNGTNPDIIICYIGINDFLDSHNEELGNWGWNETYHHFDGHSAIPSDGNIATFSEAYALMLAKIMQTYPNAEVYCCTLLESNMTAVDTQDSTKFPVMNSKGYTLTMWNDTIKNIAKCLGANIINLHECGINYWNVDSYTWDLTHPNDAGTTLMSEKIYSDIISQTKLINAD